jgi:hypothetical protein
MVRLSAVEPERSGRRPTAFATMTTTATQALQILRAIATGTSTAARFAYAHRRQALDTIARVLLAIEAAARWCWAHRQQARDAALLTVLATLTAAAWCYRAGRTARRAVDTISRRSCALLPHQPVPAVAPITATLTAAREALERLVVRLYPQPVAA